MTTRRGIVSVRPCGGRRRGATSHCSRPRALLVLTARIRQWSRADDASAWDVPLYQSFGDRMAGGAVPYRDFRVEYPPGSLPAFLLPSLVAPDGDPVYEPELNDAARGYARAFAGLMTVLLGATVIVTALSLGALRVTVGHAAAALGLVGATPLLLGELALTRFDALPVALTARDRRRAPPRPAAPRRSRARPRDHGEALPASPRAPRRDLRGPPLRPARGAALGRDHRRDVGTVVLPFLALAPGEAWFSIRAQLARGVQVESLPGSIAVALGVAADKLGLGRLGVGIAEGGTGEVRSADVTGALGQVVGAPEAWLRWRSSSRYGSRPGGARPPGRLVRDCAAVVAAQLAFGRVLSPQFVLWLVPLVPLVSGRRGRLATALLAAALVMTHAWFPGSTATTSTTGARPRPAICSRGTRCCSRARRARGADGPCFCRRAGPRRRRG